MRPVFPLGKQTTSSPSTKLPSSNVPVTTVPKPERVKTRSTGKRGRLRSRFGGISANNSASLSLSCSKPSPVLAETRKTGAFSRLVPSTSSWASSSTNSSNSRSATRSHLVRTIKPREISSKSKMARCSRVWALTPSLAAMTRRTASMPPMPESMLPTKSRCPGTSIIPIVSPPGSVMDAKPRSMVISRSISSFKRSGLVPVKAEIRVDFP